MIDKMFDYELKMNINFNNNEKNLTYRKGEVVISKILQYLTKGEWGPKFFMTYCRIAHPRHLQRKKNRGNQDHTMAYSKYKCLYM